MAWTDFAPFSVGQVVDEDDFNELIANLALLHQAHGVKTYRASTVALSGTSGKVPFVTESFDSDGFHDTGSNTSRHVVPVGLAGLYLLHGQVGFPTGLSGTTAAVSLLLNNTTTLAIAQESLGTIAAEVGIATIASLAEGDYIELVANSAITAQSGISITFFEMTWRGKL